MNDFSIMTMFKSKAYLSEPVQYLLLTKQFFALNLLIHFDIQIASVNKLHDYTQLPLLGLVDFSECDDIRVTAEYLQYFCLS